MKKQKKEPINLDKTAERIRRYLGEKDAVRESCLKTCREIIRLSSTAIRAVHRQEKAQAQLLIDQSSSLVQQLSVKLKGKHPDILSANYMHDACKEYAEASITYHMIFENKIPAPDLLRVTYPAYLNGLAEAVGELRRYILDGLRKSDFRSADYLLGAMDSIYSMLVTMDFPDAVTYGLRRNTDNARGIIERTRADLTVLIHSYALQRKINSFSRKLGNSADQI